MKRVLYTLWQVLWGFPQTFFGFFVFLSNLKCSHYISRGAVVTEWKYKSGLSLGLFVFIGQSLGAEQKSRTLTHEYGHTIQSLILGPFYLVAVGLPSIIWAGLPCFVRLRERRGISYSRLYCERWANKLGKAATGCEALD